MKEPFKRMAMDVVGPLPHTKSGNKFLLVVMDYATKWPEAFDLRNVTTETIVHCLVEMAARIGVPEELLFDNGFNFMPIFNVEGIKNSIASHECQYIFYGAEDSLIP